MEKIDAGGFGTIWSARDGAGDPVIAKVADTAEGIRRLFDEATYLSNLGHPNLVRVFAKGDAVIDGKRQAYLIEERIDGRSFSKALANKPPARSFVEIREAIGWSHQLLAGLAAAHAAATPIVHRDIAPDNVMLCNRPAGLVKVIDFGLAKPKQGTNGPPRHAHTAFGQIVGKRGAIPPEAPKGAPADPTMDVYASALLIYQFFSRKRPYPPGTLPVARPKKLPRLAVECHESLAWLDEILGRAYASDPKQRYRDAGEMLDAFVTALKDHKIQVPELPDEVTEPQPVALEHHVDPRAYPAAQRTMMDLPAPKAVPKAAPQAPTMIAMMAPAGGGQPARFIAAPPAPGHIASHSLGPSERVVATFLHEWFMHPAEALERFAGPDMMVVVPATNKRIEGVAEIARRVCWPTIGLYAARYTSAPDGKVGFFATVKSTTSVQPIAWLFTVRDGRIRAWEWYSELFER